MTAWYWSAPLAGFGVVGLALAGRRSYWGWVLGLVDEALWVVYAVRSSQWSFCVSAAAYGWVYARNLRAWRRAASATAAAGGSSGFAVGAGASGDPRRSAVAGGGGVVGAFLDAVGGADTRRAVSFRARFGGLAAVLVMLLAGCVHVAGDAPRSGPVRPGPAGSGTASGAQLAEFAVRQAYEEFWWVVSRIDEQPPVRWRGVLSLVATEPELSRQVERAKDRAARGVHGYGEVVVHIAAVRSALTMRATLLDCQDASQSGEAENGTGRVLSTGRAGVRAVGTLVRDREFGPWRVTDVRYPGERC